MEPSLVSIITPCYNCEKLVDQTIKSILGQTYTNWELLLINDGSSDNTGQVLDYFASLDPRISVIHLKLNQGIANARNKGIEESRGHFISFLDSDDLWNSEKLEKQLTFMKENNHFFSHTAYTKIDIDGKVISNIIPVSKSVTYKSLLKHNEIGCLTAMYNVSQVGKRYFKKIGHEDFACWLEILKDGYCSFGINEPLAYYRIHGNTASGNKLKVIKYTWNIYRNIEKISFIKSLYFFSFYASRSLIKYLK